MSDSSAIAAATSEPDPADGNAMTKTPFGAFLHQHRKGSLHNELTEALAQVVAGSLEHHKKGELTVKVKIACGEVPGSVIVTDEVKAKVPEADRDGSLFFGDGEGNLSRTDPRQTEIEGLREVPGDD